MRKRKPGAGRPVEMPFPWKELAMSTGGSGELAKRLGVGTSTLNKWVRGVHRIPILARKEIERLCKYYEIEFSFEKNTDSFGDRTE